MKRQFKVWAPNAKEVTVVVNGRMRPTEALGEGYYGAELAPDVDYFVRVDGRDLPDPRSPFQPQGVHAPSRWISGDFAWHDAGFRAVPLSAAVIYELHVGTFSPEGTFAGAAQKLGHLRELGVTHVELMPVNTFPGRWGWGYDGVSLFAPHSSYGSPEDLKRLVSDCHQLGLAVLLDVVYNHLGPDGNYLAQFGPYFTHRYETPWGSAINLDGPESDHVRRFFIDNALMWLRDYHFDGLRLDAVHAFHDSSAFPFLQELAEEVHALGLSQRRPLVVIAESDLNDPRLIRPAQLGGYGLDAQWSDDFHHALHAVLTGERNGYYADFGKVSDIARALREGFVLHGQYSQFRRRRHGYPLGEIEGGRLLGYLQTHDQVGNRARGERMAALTTPGLLRIGSALTLLSPFVPMLFQGEEWAASTPFPYFADHQDAQLAEAVRTGRREEFRAFGWKPEDIPDPQAEATYRGAILDWEEQLRSPHHEVLAWYRALLRLRASTAQLLDGRRDRVEVTCDDDKQTLSLTRGSVTLQANFGTQPVRLPYPGGEPVLHYPEPPSVDGGQLHMGPHACCVWKRG